MLGVRFFTLAFLAISPASMSLALQLTPQELSSEVLSKAQLSLGPVYDSLDDGLRQISEQVRSETPTTFYSRDAAIGQLKRMSAPEYRQRHAEAVEAISTLRNSISKLRNIHLSPSDFSLLAQAIHTIDHSQSIDAQFKQFQSFFHQRSRRQTSDPSTMPTNNTHASNQSEALSGIDVYGDPDKVDNDTATLMQTIGTVVEILDTGFAAFNLIDQMFIQPIASPVKLVCNACGIALAVTRTAACLWHNKYALNSFGLNEQTLDLFFCASMMFGVVAFGGAVGLALMNAKRSAMVIMPLIYEYYVGSGDLAQFDFGGDATSMPFVFGHPPSTTEASVAGAHGDAPAVETSAGGNLHVHSNVPEEPSKQVGAGTASDLVFQSNVSDEP